MIKLRKDESKLIEKRKVPVVDDYYFHMFLWEDQESLDANTVDNKSGESACCINLTTWKSYVDSNGKTQWRVRPKLGEAHFIKDKWTIDIVWDELEHVLLTHPWEKVIEPPYNCEYEVWYWFGGTLDAIYNLLWEINFPSEEEMEKHTVFPLEACWFCGTINHTQDVYCCICGVDNDNYKITDTKEWASKCKIIGNQNKMNMIF